MASQLKELGQIHARAGRTERNYHSGLVEVTAMPLWLKSDVLAVASITPRAAIELASELLNAAIQAQRFGIEEGRVSDG